MMADKVGFWLKLALEDLKVAEHEVEIGEEKAVTGAVCFHSQQFVEKALKAYLVSREKDFEKTHNLEHLVRLCSKLNGDFSKLDTGNLTSYAVNARYPDDFYIPSYEEAVDCYKLAGKIKAFVFEKLGVKNDKDIV